MLRPIVRSLCSNMLHCKSCCLDFGKGHLEMNPQRSFRNEVKYIVSELTIICFSCAA